MQKLLEEQNIQISNIDRIRIFPDTFSFAFSKIHVNKLFTNAGFKF